MYVRTSIYVYYTCVLPYIMCIICTYALPYTDRAVCGGVRMQVADKHTILSV